MRLDLWDSLGLARDGGLSWHRRQMQRSDFVLVVCSPGLCRGRPEDEDGEEEEEEEEGLKRASDGAVRLIAEEVCRAKGSGQDLSRYMAAIFEHCDAADVPAALSLVSNYSLPRDLLLLFSHLHRVALYRPGSCLEVKGLSEEALAQLPAGAALQEAISEAATAMEAARHRSPEAEA